MANIELDDLGKRRDGFGARIIEAMAGMDLETEDFRERGCNPDTFEFTRCDVVIARSQRIAPCAGMEFDHGGANGVRRFNLVAVRGDEQRYPDSGPAKGPHRVLDDGALTDRTNCMMLAALPGTVSDGGAKTLTNTGTGGATATQATFVGAAASAASLRRFLVGPAQCEITGVDTTPDGRTLFVGIQHPGEDGTPAAPSSHWPTSQAGAAGATVRPRSAVIAITKDDGGIVGL